MKIFNFMMAALLVSSTGWAFTKERMQGNTQNEREIRWIWKNLKEFTFSCQASESECQVPALSPILTELNNYLQFPGEENSLKWSQLLEFVSEKEHPDLFETDKGQAHRVAVTGLNKFSKVYINTDRMNLPLEDWVGILTHEAIHHLGQHDGQSRMPDQIGSEVARHFQKRILTKNLAQFGQPETVNLVFNSKGPERLTIGLLTSSEMAFDINWGSTPLLSLCQASEKPVREFVGLGSWTMNRIEKVRAVVTLHGGGFINIECRSRLSGQTRRTSLLIGSRIELQYPQPFKLEDINTVRPTLIGKTLNMGPSNDPSDLIGSPNQSFLIEKITHEKNEYLAGESWKTKVVVLSMDGYQPKNCQLVLSGVNWSYWSYRQLPALQAFDQCVVSPLGRNRYELEGNFQFPEFMQPDDFYVSLILFRDPRGDRLALPAAPTFVHVSSPHSPPPAQVMNPQFEGLTPLESWRGETLLNSYQIKPDQSFELTYFVQGSQEIKDLHANLELWLKGPNGQQGYGGVNGPVGDVKEVFEKVDYIRQQGGTLVKLRIRLPSSLRGIPLYGFKIQSFQMEMSDFSWVELNFPHPLEAVIIAKP